MKQYGLFPVNFNSKHAQACGTCMGLFLFLRILYYFGFFKFSLCSAGELTIQLIIPLIAAIGFLVLYCIMRLNAPGIYGIICSIFCALLAIGSVFTGDIPRVILAFLWYALSAVAILAATGGFIPDKIYATSCFGIAFVVRILLFTLPQILGQGTANFPQLINDAADLFLMLSMTNFSQSLRKVE